MSKKKAKLKKTNKEKMFEFKARILKMNPNHILKAELDGFIPYVSFDIDEDDIWLEEDSRLIDEASSWLNTEYLMYLQDYGYIGIDKLQIKLEKEIKKYQDRVIEKELLR